MSRETKGLIHHRGNNGKRAFPKEGKSLRMQSIALRELERLTEFFEHCLTLHIQHTWLNGKPECYVYIGNSMGTHMEKDIWLERIEKAKFSKLCSNKTNEEKVIQNSERRSNMKKQWKNTGGMYETKYGG
ncbi:hypothetical protein RUM44_005660 [Polyplax serrata]|uniref:LAGLIDADG homing endonuclease n=1 Tax=Polyplax serrata TaxID=468196 RepID=A0ABR1AW73_POLSC